ncbi:MAG TPA: hypothetical protein VGD30_10770, partial [Telluria sp.]
RAFSNFLADAGSVFSASLSSDIRAPAHACAAVEATRQAGVTGAIILHIALGQSSEQVGKDGAFRLVAVQR